MYNLKINSLSYATEAEAATALRTAFLTAGGSIGSVPAAVATDFMVDCSDELPATPKSWGWTRRASDKQVNLYRGKLDMREVTSVQAPSQLKEATRLDKIQRKLNDCEFVGAHGAEWYAKPENAAFFPEEWKTGYTIFLEKYRDSNRNLRVVYLYWHDGRVGVSFVYADDDCEFDAANRFAVRKLSA